MSNSSELIYTSAPQGLRTGSRGFCTVAMSENMPAGLVGPLEGLSAYRNLEGDGLAPVNFMHVQLKVAGRSVNVLSRVADAPPDYTGRTNKLAHHIVIATADRIDGGPAALLRHAGFSIQSWDGKVRKISEPKSIPALESPLRVAEGWATQVGDAGWAGYVAAILANKASGPPAFIIYRREQSASLLQLIDEAICLLPQSQRWNATFATYASELPPGIDCRLRCLLSGSPEATAIPPSATRIDLTSGRLGPVPPGPYVDAARTGELATSRAMTSSDAPLASSVGSLSTVLALRRPPAPTFDDPFTVAPPPRHQPQLSGQPPPLGETSNSGSSRNWPLLVIAATLLLVCLGGVGAFSFLQSDSGDLLAELNASAGIEAKPNETLSTTEQPPTTSPIDVKPAQSVEGESMAKEEAEPSQKEQDHGTQQEQSDESLEETAARILGGQSFIDNQGESSLNAFVKELKKEIADVVDAGKQLKEMQLEPSGEELSDWERAENFEENLAKFVGKKRGETDALSTHTTNDHFQNRYMQFQQSLKAWDASAKLWQAATQEHPEMTLKLDPNGDVDKVIVKVRDLARKTMGQSAKSLLARHEAVLTEARSHADSHKHTLDLIQDTRLAELAKRRESHRLRIYFDGNINRREEKLRVRPVCVIPIDQNEMKKIDRLKLDQGTPSPFVPATPETTQMGRYQGWMTLTRTNSGIQLEFNPRSVPNHIAPKGSMLERLKSLVDKQDKAFGSRRLLSNLIASNELKINSDLELRLQAANQDAKKTIEKQKSDLFDFKNVFDQQPKPDLDQMYIESGAESVSKLESTKPSVIDLFGRLSVSVPIAEKIDDHIKNLNELRDAYQELKLNLSLFDLGGALELGSASKTNEAGQEYVTPIVTFELFFIPELQYGPPSND